MLKLMQRIGLILRHFSALTIFIFLKLPMCWVEAHWSPSQHVVDREAKSYMSLLEVREQLLINTARRQSEAHFPCKSATDCKHVG